MPSKRQQKHKLPFIIIATVLVLVIASGYWLYSSQKQSKVLTRGTAGAEPAQMIGPVNAGVRMEEFGDFQCPSCGALHPVLKKLEAEYDTRVSLIFRELPLVQIHPNALEAAKVAEAAGLQGRFWQMHDRLYDYQSAWSDSSNVRMVFGQYAESMGLDAQRLSREMDSPIVRERIEADQRRALSLGIAGTPTLLLNGREVSPDALNEKDLRALIEAALKQP